MLTAVIYLDYNASAPLHPSAREAWLRATDDFPGNPSSPHRAGRRAEHAIEDARDRLARSLAVPSADIVWTSGATEGNNTALHHAARISPSDARVAISAIEHPSLRSTAHRLFPGRVDEIPCDAEGRTRMDQLEAVLLRSRPALVAVMAANNETGVIQDWQTAARLCRRFGTHLLCDATQWIGRLPAEPLAECDWIVGSGHKFGGPRGVGFLRVPRTIALESLLLGGGQELGRRAGTENVAGILGLVAALDAAQTHLRHSGPGEDQLRTRTAFELGLKQVAPGTRILGENADRLWNTVSAILPPASEDCRQRWVVRLDRLGFAVSTGSACASGKEAPSHVLSAMGVSDDHASRVLRFSAGWSTPAEHWEALLNAIATVLNPTPRPQASTAS